MSNMANLVYLGVFMKATEDDKSSAALLKSSLFVLIPKENIKLLSALERSLNT
jgi:hypothetical protein